MRKTISIDKLVVNPENYRFDPVENQSQAIDLMLDEKGEELVVLAKHIIENGLDEAKSLRVVEMKKDLFKIMEGNRRITTLKCLHTPSLIKSDSLRNKFLKIVEEAKKEGKSIPSEINCFLYKSEEEAAKWVKLDHTGKNDGAGLDPWGAAEKNRFDYKFGGKLSPAMQAVTLFEKETGTKIDKKDLKVSTIDRIISNVEGRSYLGLGMSNEEIYLTSTKEEVVKRLDKLFSKILVEDTPVSEVYKSEGIVKFMKDLFGDKPKSSKTPVSVTKELIKKTKNPIKKSLPRSNGRNVIIPNTCILVIHPPKINNIYHELKDLQVKEYVNAAGVLFRVFFEVSLDEYAAKNGINFSHQTKLSTKIIEVTHKLEKDNAATQDQLRYIRKIATKGNAILSIDHFNEYVHSTRVQPLPMDMINTWDNIQEFFEILWGEIAKKNKKK